MRNNKHRSTRSVQERLKDLFSSLEQVTDRSRPKSIPSPSGWTWECNGQGIITFCSPEIRQVLGYSPAEVSGHVLTEFALPSKSAQALKSAMRANMIPLEINLEYLAKDGLLVPVSFHVVNAPLNGDQNGTWQGFVQTITQTRTENVDVQTQQSAPDEEILETKSQILDPSTENKKQNTSDLAEPTEVFPKNVFDKADLANLHSAEEITHSGPGGKLSVPLKLPDQLSGRIEVQGKESGATWNEDERLLVEQVADQLSLALENARLFKYNTNLLSETRRRNDELAAINAITNAVSRSLDLEAILSEALAQILGMMDYQAGVITMVDPSTGELTLAANQGLPKPLLEKFTTTGLSGTLCDLVFQLGESINLDDLTNNPPVDTQGLVATGLRSYMGVPLESKGKILGTLCVFGDSVRSTSQEDLNLTRTAGQQIGIALENAQLFEQTQETLNRTENLYQAIAGFNAANNYIDILATLRQHTLLGEGNRTVTTLAYFDVPWTEEQTPEWIEIIERWTPAADPPSTASRLPLKEFEWFASAFHPNAPLCVENATSHPLLDDFTKSWAGQENYQSAILLPLMTGGKWYGFIGSFYAEPRHFPISEHSGLMALAGQAAVAVQNIRLLEESISRANQLETAADIARETSATLDLDALLQRTVNLIRGRFGFYHASVFLVDEEEDFAVVRASTGRAGEEMLNQGHKLTVGSNSIMGRVTKTGLPLVVNDVEKNPIHQPNPLLPKTCAELGIPLKIGNRVIGAFDVQSTKVNAFNDDDIRVLQILADQIAVALENARLYDELRQTAERLREIDQLKSEFLANMSHELRTPLNSIIGFSRVIIKGIDGPINDLQEQDLSAIHASGQHLLNMINDILDLSKIEAGKMEMAIEEIDLEELITSAMSTARGLVKDKPIQLDVQLPEGLPKINADPTKIRQVIINLLSNAAKFTDEGSIIIQGNLENDEYARQYLLISVKDTGIGIAPDDQEKLFEPFSQVDSSTTRKSGGTGLGLSISRALIEMHDGKIGVESEPGHGSRFYFTLPIPSPDTTSMFDFDPKPNQKLILAIDDNPQVINLYTRYLTEHGFQVVPATDSKTAVAQAQELQPYAISLDLMMPGLDGWEVLKDLKENPTTKDIPVVICSILEEQLKAMEMGASDYLTKPILEDDMVHTFIRLSGEYTQPQELRSSPVK